MEMADSVKLLSNTAAFSTSANDVFGAVAALITVSGPTLISQINNANTTIATVVLDKGSYIIRKAPSDVFTANVTINATAVAL